VLRSCDVQEQGVHPEQLRRLVDAGDLVKVGRGLYAPADHDPSEHVDLAQASARVPRGVICLLSALSYHGIGTQLPHEVWMMIDRRAHKPAAGRPPLRIVLGSGHALTADVERVDIDGREVPVFGPAKTVVDCFRYRRHVGLDVAIEALRETLAGRHATPAEVGEIARLCRVGTVVRPYLEALA
jgi:predicted transcriptional regulator of viral defense system